MCNIFNIFFSLFFSPPVNPPKEIDDPHDKRPADWDDKEKYVHLILNILVMNLGQFP